MVDSKGHIDNRLEEPTSLQFFENLRIALNTGAKNITFKEFDGYVKTYVEKYMNNDQQAENNKLSDMQLVLFLHSRGYCCAYDEYFPSQVQSSDFVRIGFDGPY